MGQSVRQGPGSVKPMRLTHAALGKLGEGLVLVWLMAQGWQPFPRPAREQVQTDLLLQRDATLLLVEVKTRRRLEPLEKVLSHAQRERLRRQAAWLAARQPNLTVRLDAVVVTPQWPFLRRYVNILYS